MDARDPPFYFGEWLKRRRKALDLTQEELSQRAGCSVFALRKIESGERRPSKQLARLLARALEIPPEERPTFTKVARGERNLERLREPSPASSIPSLPWLKPVPSPIQLPVQFTSLVGREAELAALERLLRDPQCRLLTLTGLGGIGKTRLAIELASTQRSLFPGGVYYVELASLSSPEFILPAIADAIRLTFSGPIDSKEQLLNFLGGRAHQAMLLVLDNLEHLLVQNNDEGERKEEAATLLVEMLQRIPNLKILVTSRERLNLQGEWAFELHGLPVPSDMQSHKPEDYSAVILFVQRARRVKVDFEIKPEEQAEVVRICQLVEGTPLAIELAAAWVGVLSFREIAQEIESNLDFLATSMRDVPERHWSMRATFDHSWNLLSGEEQRLLRRLSVFRGGFQREAAEEVAGASLPLLASLISKSLLHRMESERYDFHEVVRQYALSRLAEDPQSESTRDRHSEFYLGLLSDREQALKGANLLEAIRELTDEIDNVRAAWTWAVRRENFLSLGRALPSLTWLCDTRGWLNEGIEQLDLIVQVIRARTEANGEHQKILGQALAQQGMLFFRQGLHERAQTLFKESLAILRPIGDPTLLPGPLIFFGVIMYLNGEFDQAKSLLDEGYACAQAAQDPWFTALALFNLGYMTSCLGGYTEAYEQMQDSLAIWRVHDDPRMIALGLNFLGPVAIQLGRHEEAGVFLQESLSLTMQLGDRWGMGTAYRHLGVLALAQGDIPKAQSLIQKSLALFTDLGTRWDIGRSLIYLGKSSIAAGDFPEARRIFLEAIPIAMGVQAKPIVLDALNGLAHLHNRSGDIQAALELSVFVMNHPASNQETKNDAAQLTQEIETKIAPEQIKSAHWQAQTKQLQAVVEGILVDK